MRFLLPSLSWEQSVSLRALSTNITLAEDWWFVAKTDQIVCRGKCPADPAKTGEIPGALGIHWVQVPMQLETFPC